jgi:hypothetical protein
VAARLEKLEKLGGGGGTSSVACYLPGPAHPMHLSIDTILPADSVEFCPHPDASNVFVCGTYKLQDEQNLRSPALSPSSGPAAGQTQIRTGQCLVYEVDSDQEEINVCDTPSTTVVLCMRVFKLRTTIFQLQDPGDISPCNSGSEMVREAFSFSGLYEGLSKARPPPGVTRRQADGR